MLDFERALAEAEGDAGVIPQEAARVIASACAELSLSPEALAREGKRSGSLAVPLVKALTEQVARADARAAAFVHYGSTSQDVLDTALVLCLKPCLADADRVLATAVSRLAGHARRHAGVVMLGRTLMQPATPITAGLKIARWAAALHRCRLRLAEARERALCIQLGGAVGTLDALGGKRAAVRHGAGQAPGSGRGARVARPARRAAAADGRAGDRHRDRGQDRARRGPALAGRGRRDAGVAADEGRGRLERHAPQAQPRGLSAGAGRRGPRPRPDGDAPVAARSASTSARSAAGRPSS